MLKLSCPACEGDIVIDHASEAKDRACPKCGMRAVPKLEAQSLAGEQPAEEAVVDKDKPASKKSKKENLSA